MGKTNAFKEHIHEVRELMGLQDGESLLAAIRAMKNERDRLAATVAAARDECTRGLQCSYHEYRAACEAVLRILDSPVSAVRVTFDRRDGCTGLVHFDFEGHRINGEWPIELLMLLKVKCGDTLLLVKVRDHE